MRIPKAILKIIQLAAPENFRYAMNTMQLSREPGSTKATAGMTDGRVALTVTFDDPDDKPIIGFEDLEKKNTMDGFNILLSSRSVSTARQIARSAGSQKVVVIGEELVDGKVQIGIPNKLPGDGTQIAFRPVTGQKPPIDAVIPKYKEGESVKIAVNPRLLANLLMTIYDAMDADDSMCGVWLEIPTQSGPRPLKITSAKGAMPGIVAVLMPMAMQKE